MAVYTGLVCIRKKVSAVVFLKKVFPVFLIEFTTASSAAAFLENRKVCGEKLGIDKNLRCEDISCMAAYSADHCGSTGCGYTTHPRRRLACYTILLLQLEIPAAALSFRLQEPAGNERCAA